MNGATPAQAINIGPAPRSAGTAPLSTTPTNQDAIIAQQLMLLATQAVLVRALEDALTISPPGPVPPIAPPGAGVTLQTVIDAQTAAIRTQAAYTKHLEDLMTALALPLP